MRTIRKYALWGCLALAGLTVLTYAADDVLARLNGRPVEQIKVDPVFAETNRYNEVEYSAGTPFMQTCLDALMPHFGLTPCWYLRRHTLKQVGP